MYRQIKILSALAIFSTACVQESKDETISHVQLEIDGQEEQATSMVHERETFRGKALNLEPNTNGDCVSEILTASASASSRNPAEIKFEIEGRSCENDFFDFTARVLEGYDDVPMTRGWNEIERVENENGHFKIIGELWSCGFFSNADHIEVIALSEIAATAPLRFPIALVEEPTETDE